MATTFVVYQSLTPEMVTRAELPAAVALNGVGINLARGRPRARGTPDRGAQRGRAVLHRGRAHGGGDRGGDAAAPRSPPAAGSSWPRPCGPGCASCVLVAGAVVLVRGALFSLFASGLWALLPVVALDRLDLGSRGFGVLMGCVGAGAVTGAARCSACADG